jgi:ABC-type Zn uptake system ZnuABC Zn-binding protein ZnuA
MRWFALLLLALALVAAGCGGSDDESSAADETTVETSTTTETTETTFDSDEDVAGILGDEDCLQLASIGATFAQAITGASDEEAVEAFEQLADEVPDEISADVQILADWFAEYTAQLEDIGLQAGQPPSAEQLQQLQTALAATDQEELSAASERLQVWANENCEAAGG